MIYGIPEDDFTGKKSLKHLQDKIYSFEIGGSLLGFAFKEVIPMSNLKVYILCNMTWK